MHAAQVLDIYCFICTRLMELLKELFQRVWHAINTLTILPKCTLAHFPTQSSSGRAQTPY